MSVYTALAVCRIPEGLSREALDEIRLKADTLEKDDPDNFALVSEEVFNAEEVALYEAEGRLEAEGLEAGEIQRRVRGLEAELVAKYLRRALEEFIAPVVEDREDDIPNDAALMLLDGKRYVVAGGTGLYGDPPESFPPLAALDQSGLLEKA